MVILPIIGFSRTPKTPRFLPQSSSAANGAPCRLQNCIGIGCHNQQNVFSLYRNNRIFQFTRPFAPLPRTAYGIQARTANCRGRRRPPRIRATEHRKLIRGLSRRQKQRRIINQGNAVIAHPSPRRFAVQGRQQRIGQIQRRVGRYPAHPNYAVCGLTANLTHGIQHHRGRYRRLARARGHQKTEYDHKKQRRSAHVQHKVAILSIYW